ncbi:MAG: hypothetical protein KJO41_01765 [Bacteroidia bacterium]|nr:hypothetical protein [Bacteroidia bacterium]MBT8277700.1 hypothetical protein [Bacteroidia bacterium]NND25949.1 hypothetical protein [Flavobacteriaceae bacterium]NNK59220.1 hypothetical protein [Flavobacteriaceae bacterium]NNL32334.1 hypothetical protein [Flavobacteriaceae bacterium]
MSTKTKFFISCNEANHNCDKSQYNEASIWEKIKLNIHLIYCRACRKYSKNNATLTQLIKNENVDCLEAKEKEVLERSFNKELRDFH